MRAIDIKVAVRVALIYGLRGLASAGDRGIISLDESMQGMRALRQWEKIPSVLQSVLAVRDMFAAICSDVRVTPDEYYAMILEFFDKDFRDKI